MGKSRILTESPSSWMERVWRENASQIYKLCCFRSSDVESAKDLFQEVALRFCKSAEVLDHEKPILPWIMTVIRNTRCDLHRRSLPVIPLNRVPEYLYCVGDGRIDREIYEERRERFIRRQLDDLMACLTASEKVAVEYNCIGGICVDEASVYCGTSKCTFFKRKSIALKKMRDKKDSYMSMLQKNGSSPLDLEDLLSHAGEFS